MITLDNLVATYTTVRGKVHAVDRVSLTIPDGQIVGVAGESGCGKSTLMKVLYGNTRYPLALTQGSVDYGIEERGTAITHENVRQFWFKRISYMPQSSMSSLNPVVRIRNQFVDFAGSGQVKKYIIEEVRAYVQELGLPPESIDAYPHQLSGGMRQRIMVAMATYFKPDIILADEPTTALDVVVQKSILLLLMKLQQQMRNTIILVSHDMGVHYQITHRMLIMYAAQVVEYGDSESVFKTPLHPYTRLLIESLPTIGDDHLRHGAQGRPPSLWEDLHGCRFAARCPLATALCRSDEPELKEYKPGHFAACHYAQDTMEQKINLDENHFENRKLEQGL